MRSAIVALVLAISCAQNTVNDTGGQQQGQLKGCDFRCRKLTFIGEGSVPVKPNWAVVDLSVEVSSQQLQNSGNGGNMNMGGNNVNMGNNNLNNRGGNNNLSSGSNFSSGGNLSGGSSQAMKVRDEAQHRALFILNYLQNLSSTDLKDLQAEEISFKPDFDDSDGDDKFIGYKATFGLSFKVVIDKFQDVLDHIVGEQGANRVDSIVFVADDQTEKQAHLKAIELATQDAWDQAQAIAKVMGLQGNLRLLSVRDKLAPVKKIIRRFARNIRDHDMRGGMDMMGGRGGMGNDWDDFDDSINMLQWLEGDQIVNALLVYQFDFQDGTINMQQVQPIESNLTVSDAFGGLLKGGKQGQNLNNQPQTTNAPQQPVTNMTVVNATNATIPANTVGVTNTAQPVNSPAPTTP